MDLPSFLALSLGNPSGFSQNTLIAMVALSAFILIVAAVAMYIWRRLRENEILKYEFITIVAHKFRTPLTHVKWSTDNLLSAEQDPFKKESLQDIRKANENLIGLTGTLIEVADTDNAKASSYAFERISLCDLAREVADGLKVYFKEKNLFFSVKCDDPNIMVKADRARMGFVLQAILENAYLYTSPGKNVDVTVGRSGRKAFVSVTDHGIGISKSDLPRIFTKLYRAHNAQLADTEGFGVSLFLARSIVSRHRGKISVFSEGKDQGSTFTVILPKVR